MSRTPLRRYGTVLGLAVAATVLPAAPATASIATVPAAPAPVSPAATGPSTVELTPGWLPAGYVAHPAQTDFVPSAAGPVTYTTTRYAVPAPAGDRVTDILYLEVVRGGSGLLVGPGEVADPTTVAGRPAVYVGGAVREYRFSLDDVAPGVTGTLGAHGGISEADLRAVADSLAASPVPAPEAPAIVAIVPGDSTGGDTNMKGSGTTLTNDWGPTDGSNVQISQRSTDVYKGNVVGVWQAIMWADHATFYTPETNVTERYKSCQVDGGFGLVTTRATYWEQDRFGLAMDGIVSPLTWSKVDDFLRYSGSLVVYRGMWETLYFQRQSTAPGDYSWSWNYSSYRYTGYYTVNLVKSTTCT